MKFSGNKTVKVAVQRFVKDKKYKKYVKKVKNYLVHNDKTDLKEGDKVEIVETRPISKNKHFKILNIIEEAVSLEEK